MTRTCPTPGCERVPPDSFARCLSCTDALLSQAFGPVLRTATVRRLFTGSIPGQPGRRIAP